jgi:aminotransferase EvaB
VRIPVNDLSRWESDEINEILTQIGLVCTSGTFMLGDNTRKLEALLSDVVGQPEVICVANGTDALTLAMLGLGLGSTSKIATVGNAGGYATAAALRVGALPVMVDVDAKTAQMSPESLSRVLAKNPEVEAVVLTHLYGLVGNVEEIQSICKKFGAYLIEDCAQAIGAAHNEEPAGSFGDVATMSFYPTKNLGALGDAGAVAARSSVVASRIRRLAQYGWSARYCIEEPHGFNSRIDEIQAAILCSRLPTLVASNQRRRLIINRYQESVAPGRYIIGGNGPNFVGHLAVVVSPRRDEDRLSLEEHGIQTAIHYPIPDFEQTAWKNVIPDADCPNTEFLGNAIFTLPCFPRMRDDEVLHVCKALSSLKH